MNVNPPTNRLRGSLPKIGIRPTIDGRFGGVRESLEGQTMGQAACGGMMVTPAMTFGRLLGDRLISMETRP